MYKVKVGFKSNNKIPVQVQVEPKKFSVLVWSWSGESFKSLAQVLAEIFQSHISSQTIKYLYKFKLNQKYFLDFGLVLVWSGSGENFKYLAQVLGSVRFEVEP